MTAKLRYFCLVVPGDTVQHGFDYVEALNLTQLGVRVMPIGMAMIMGRWSGHMGLFKTELAERYINIVCAPPRMSLGVPMTGAMMAAPAAAPGVEPPRLPGHLEQEKSAATEEVVYRPQTALVGLYTLGVPNVAITSPKPHPPTPEEVTALQKYDYVLAPTYDDSRALHALGVPALHVPACASQLAKLLAPLLKE